MPIEISVVIPTFKRPLLLKKCITALTYQQMEKGSYEIIVVSDGYDSETETVVRNFSTSFPAISYHHLSLKKGPAAARNCGWKLAKGILVAFTDDDTVPEPQWLSAYLQAYRGEQLVAFSGRVRVPISELPT